jgi:hypothetical protein
MWPICASLNCHPWSALQSQGSDPLTASNFGTAPPVSVSLSRQLLSATSISFGSCSPLAAGDWLVALQRQFPKVFFQDAAASPLAPSHCVQHMIQTVGQLATAKFRQLDLSWLAAAMQEFQSMLDEDIIRR